MHQIKTDILQYTVEVSISIGMKNAEVIHGVHVGSRPCLRAKSQGYYGIMAT